MEKENLRKYFFWTLILILLLISYFIIKPYIIALISSFILAYLILPIFRILNKKLPKSISAALCILIIILILILPVSIIISGLLTQANQSLSLVSIHSSLTEKISSLPFLENLDLESLREKGIQLFIQTLGNTAKQIPHLALSILIIIFSLYYTLTNWDLISKNLRKYIPFGNKEKISSEIARSTKQIVYGYVFIAILEFIVASVGFYISGVQFFFLFAALIALFAFIPGVGPGAVWVLLAVYHISTGNYTTAVGIIITGLLISIGIEFFLIPKIIGKRANIHPLIILLGVIGGVPLFGIFGFVIGPLVLVYSIKLLKEFVKDQ